MASSANYYLDAATLSLATAVYTNAGLTIAAADGFYADGSFVRQQVNGSLLAAAPCPACSVTTCRTVTLGVYPVTNSPSSSCSGTITVTGGTVNVWARYTKGGGVNGTAVFSTTINGVNASGSFSVTDVTPQGHTSSNGSTGAGFVTLAPGTYNFTLVKSDVLSSGNNVRLVWSVGTNPNAAAEMGAC